MLLGRCQRFSACQLGLADGELLLADLQAFVGAALELVLLELEPALTVVVLPFPGGGGLLSLEERPIGLEDRPLAQLERFGPERKLALLRCELRTKSLLALGRPDSLGLELLVDAALAVVEVSSRLGEILLEVLDARSRLRDHDVAVLQLLDQLLRARFCLRSARTVPLELVQQLGELGTTLVAEVVDDVARVTDDVGLEAVAELAHSGDSLRTSAIGAAPLVESVAARFGSTGAALDGMEP